MVNGNDGILLRTWKNVAILFFISVSISSKISVHAASDPIFSEGGGAVPYQLEEEILEELAKGQPDLKNDGKDLVADAGNKPSKSENVIPDVDTKTSNNQNRPVQPPPAAPAPAVATNAKQEYEDLKSAAAAAIMKQTNSILQQEKEKPKQKKEGQEEFATFVDPFSQPAQNRRLANEKPVYNGHVGHESKRGPINQAKSGDGDDMGDTVFIAVTTVCSAAAVFGLIGAGACWYRLHKQYKAAQDAEYPHYGVTGPAKERTSGNTSPVAAMDAKLASSAQLYHYQHTKQQIIAMEHSTGDAKGQESEDSEGEGDEGDFSVYECPGLAPTGDIEVSNPLFENMGVASPHAKVDPRQQQTTEDETPRVHQRSPVRGEDP